MELKNVFFAKVKSESEKSRRPWKRQDRDAVVNHLLNVAVGVSTMSAILFSSVDPYIGAVRVPADRVLRNAMSVWDVVKEDLSLTTEDVQHGLCLEENFSTPSGEHVSEGFYELTTWGLFDGKKPRGGVP